MININMLVAAACICCCCFDGHWLACLLQVVQCWFTQMLVICCTRWTRPVPKCTTAPSCWRWIVRATL